MGDYASKTLYFQEGTSDKVYQVVIESHDGKRYDVIAKWGRRGHTLISQPKGSMWSLDHALLLMNGLLEAKMSKGYKDCSWTDPVQTSKGPVTVKGLGKPKFIVKKGTMVHAHLSKEEDSFVPVGNATRRIKE